MIYKLSISQTRLTIELVFCQLCKYYEENDSFGLKMIKINEFLVLKRLQQFMPKLHLQRLSISSLGHQMARSKASEQHQHNLLTSLSSGRALDDITLNALYSIIRCSSKHKLDILIRSGFERRLLEWLHSDSVMRIGLERAISPRSLYQLVDLMGVMVGDAGGFPDDMMQQILEGWQKILSAFYGAVERSEDTTLRGLYLDCLSKIFKVKPDAFNINIYAEMLSATPHKLHEFYELLDFYLLEKNDHEEHILRIIFDGFTKRMKLFADKELLSKAEKRGIIKAYSKVLEFIEGQASTNQIERLLTEHQQIFQCLKFFTNRQFNHLELSKLFNGVIAAFMGSKVSNPLKFQFVLGLYKHVLQKSSSLFPFLVTDSLTIEEFLLWFVKNQLCYDKGKQILQTYFKNTSSLEFFLVMLIYYLSQFPKKAHEITNYLKCIGLFEQAKCFLDCEGIADYLRILQGLLGQSMDVKAQSQYFGEYFNSLYDRTNRIDF